ncbi:MAG TPA: AraC family transcriptional regulator [Candidatus Salinicoccus merdavium]|nr:AraC family transcriptional regulator [Candidatus Salinicoccus merdavium]
MDMLKGFNRALDYIEDNLDGQIDLKEVAKRAYSSEYHFKRLFSLLAGITISDYIRRRRLTLAAAEIKNSDIKVIDAAVKYGYQSPDAFSRAFQGFHGVLPSAARDCEKSLKTYPKMSFQLTIRGGVEMKYRIVEKEPFKIVGVKYEVEMKDEVLSPSYGHMMENISDDTMNDLVSRSSDLSYGIVHASADRSENSAGNATFTASNATFNQYIGVFSDDDPEEHSTLEIGPYKWVVFEVEGDWEHIEETWMRIYSEWLPSSAYELDSGPEILADKEDKSEIWITIKDKH